MPYFPYIHSDQLFFNQCLPCLFTEHMVWLLKNNFPFFTIPGTNFQWIFSPFWHFLYFSYLILDGLSLRWVYLVNTRIFIFFFHEFFLWCYYFIDVFRMIFCPTYSCFFFLRVESHFRFFTVNIFVFIFSMHFFVWRYFFIDVLRMFFYLAYSYFFLSDLFCLFGLTYSCFSFVFCVCIVIKS